MIIGHVGAERPYTMDDLMRRVQAMLKLETPFEGVEEDIVNLLYGRDFLTETCTYDVVIVHSVFHTNHQTMMRATIEDAIGAGPGLAIVPVSPHHSVPKWRSRLVGTQGRDILVFESQPMSLSGWTLSDLNGYDIVQLDGHVAHYRKQNG